MLLGAFLPALCCTDVEPDDDARISGGVGSFLVRYSASCRAGPYYLTDELNGTMCTRYTGFFSPFQTAVGSLKGFDISSSFLSSCSTYCSSQAEDSSFSAVHWVRGMQAVVGIDSKRWEYTFRVTGGTIAREWYATDDTQTATQYVQTFIGSRGPVDGYPDDCAEETSYMQAAVRRKGSIVTTGLSQAGDWYVVRWVPKAKQDVPAITVTFEAAALLLMPWTVSVYAGTLTLVDKDGVSYQYSGTMNEVETALNAEAGGTYFTAAVPADVDGDVLLVSDLPNWGPLAVQAHCTDLDICILRRGDNCSYKGNVTATLPTFAGVSTSETAYDDLTFTDSGFDDTQGDAILWLRRRYYPKWAAAAASDDGWTVPSPTTLPAVDADWSTVSGSSVLTVTKPVPSDTYERNGDTWQGCVGFGMCDPPSGIADPACVPCSEEEEPYLCLDAPPDANVPCWFYWEVTHTVPAFNATGSWTLSGSARLIA